MIDNLDTNLLSCMYYLQVWLYTCSAFGEIKQWWPTAVELIYQVTTGASCQCYSDPSLSSEHSLAPGQRQQGLHLGRGQPGLQREAADLARGQPLQRG